MQAELITPSSTENEKLDEAMRIAVDAHTGQVDKNGEPLILHVMRVVVKMDTLEKKIIAALHDVVEETFRTPNQYNLAYVYRMFGDQIGDAVNALTRRKQGMVILSSEGLIDVERDEIYSEEYILRLVQNALACDVKEADLLDHMDPIRVNPKTAGLQKRYKFALCYIRGERKNV